MTLLFAKRFTELQTQLDVVQKTSITKRYSHETVVDLDSNAYLEWKVKAKNLLVKVCGEQSEHYKEFAANENPGAFGTYKEAAQCAGAVFRAAKDDFDSGMLRSVRSLIQAELFTSELDQARELFKAGHIAASAVIAGVVLETTLRELCDREGIPHSKLDKMNADLAKANVYNTLVQKRITANAAVRNAAAHGQSGAYSSDDVEQMISSVESFLETVI